MEDSELVETSAIPSYKAVCAKLGLIMCVYYISRILNGIVVVLISGLSDKLNHSISYLLMAGIAVLFNYILPITVTMIAFRGFERYKGKLRELYKKPKRLARAFGTFPAMYGLGYGIALLTLLVSFLISKVSGGQSLIEDLLRPTSLEPSTDIVSLLAMVFIYVVVAPIFEEFLVRGIMYDALKPYGCGMAIIISSILFGLMHGRLNMLFYATALGFALCYIRYATGSIFVTTVLHAIVNSLAAGMLVVLTLSDMYNQGNKLINTIYSIYILALFILIIIGIFAFFKKIPVIRKYKIDNPWTEIGAGKKTALFLLSIPVLIMLVFAFNEHANNLLLNLIIS